MKKLLFIMALGASITAIGCSSNASNEEVSSSEVIQDTKGTKEDVNVEKFAELMASGKGQLLDVRTPEEWAEGIIEGAKKMNFYDDDFSNQLSKLDKTTPVYVYCRSGGRSGKAAKQMQKMGFKNVYNLEGGIGAWNDAGKPTVK